MTLDEMLQRLHRESEVSNDRVRQSLREHGRDDLIAEFDAKLRDIRLGLDGARNCWHTISAAQRFTLKYLGEGRYLSRSQRKPTLYDAYGNAGGRVMLSICRVGTVRALCAHELCHVDGGALDPEAKIIITERGSFVLRHGVPA